MRAFLDGESGDDLAVECDSPGRLSLQAKHGLGQGRLAATRFPDQPEDFAVLKCKADAIDRADQRPWLRWETPCATKRCDQVVDFDETVRHNVRLPS